MFASLRARLWLTYAVLIAVVLAIIAVGVAWTFARSPRLLYPDTVYRLRLVSETLSTDTQTALIGSPKKAARLLQDLAAARNLRLVLISPQREVIADTGGAPIAFQRLGRAALLRSQGSDQVRSIRATGGGTWLYIVHPLADGSLLVTLAPAPALPLSVLFRDQVISTFLIAGAFALALAFGLAFLISGWVTGPLRRMAAASLALAARYEPNPGTAAGATAGTAAGTAQADARQAPLAVQGPREVQELARALNEMSRRVQAGQQSQRDFVANVSHELKTPLTSVQGFAQAIVDGTAHTPAQLHQAGQVIYHEANRMHRLVLDLLSLARLEGGTADLRIAPLRVDTLLRGVVEKFQPQAQAAQVSLRADVPDLPPIPADGDRLAQVFTNLLDNAIQFTPPGGQVTLSAALESSPRGAVLAARVADSGAGIPAGEAERIFERFYQSDKSRRARAGHGVGLGLPIARQIILAHGGQIWAENRPEKGACFVVKLPVPAPTSATPKAAHS